MNSPYAQAAQTYWAKGWENPIPVGNRPGEKSPVPRGFTGRDGKKVGHDQLVIWKGQRGNLNIGIRLPRFLIAFDIDGQEGQDALTALAADIGGDGLPYGPYSTARGPESLRRHLFFRVPADLDLSRVEGILRKRYGDKLDLLHFGHRYAMVAPSTNPDARGGVYTWYGPTGEPCKVPMAREDIPELPGEWVDFLRDLKAPETGSDARSDDLWDEPEDEHRMTEEQVRMAWGRAIERFEKAFIEGNRNNAIRDLAFEAWHYSSVINEEAVAKAVARLGKQRFGWADLDHEDVGTLTRAWGDAQEQGQWVAEIVTKPEPSSSQVLEEPEDRYTDAQMAGRFARGVLAGTFVYTTALGWLKWTGRRWAPRPDEYVQEACRRWVLRGYADALVAYRDAAARGQVEHKQSEDPHVTGWTKLQGRGRIASVVALARGIEGVIRDAGEFDTHDHLLNVGNGVLDLRTGQLADHDPGLLLTKLTDADYVPGATSPALDAALAAVPEDARSWLQLHLGEALTGESGERMVLLTGSGRNGKTLLMGAVFRAMGSYAAKVPNTLLLKARSVGGPTPERMTLRGVRLAYMEETPEEGYLDSTVVKDLLDAEEIEGRHLYKDIVHWKPTHSIFLNTNHPPTMGDTGDGAWRRLARLDFPYRFRRAGEPLEKPEDRIGDPGLKAMLGGSAAGREALLAWIVAGAVRYYADGIEGVDPPSVVRGIERWREESDDLLRFVRQEMELVPGAWVPRSDMYAEFDRWLRVNGQRGISAKTFGQRMSSHSVLAVAVRVMQLPRVAPGLSRAPGLLADGLARPLGERVRAFEGIRFQASDQDE